MNVNHKIDIDSLDYLKGNLHHFLNEYDKLVEVVNQYELEKYYEDIDTIEKALKQIYTSIKNMKEIVKSKR